LVRVFGLGNGLPIVLTVFLLVFEEEALSSAGVSELDLSFRGSSSILLVEEVESLVCSTINKLSFGWFNDIEDEELLVLFMFLAVLLATPAVVGLLLASLKWNEDVEDRDFEMECDILVEELLLLIFAS